MYINCSIKYINNLFSHNQWPQTMIMLFVLGLLGTIILRLKLYNVNKEKQYLMQRIKNTAHYEITINEK